MTVSMLNGIDIGNATKANNKEIKTEAKENSNSGQEAFIDNICFEAVIPFVQVDLAQDIYIIFKRIYFSRFSSYPGYAFAINIERGDLFF